MHKAWSSIGEVSYCFQNHSSNFKVTWLKKKSILTQIWRFRTVTITSLNSPMATKWCAKLEAAQKRCPIVFSRSSVKLQSHTAEKIVNFEFFQTVTPVWIHWWIWNDAQSLMWYSRGVLSSIEIIHQISRSHGLNNRRFESKSKIE